MSFDYDVKKVVERQCELIQKANMSEDDRNEAKSVLSLDGDYHIKDKVQKEKLMGELRMQEVMESEFNRIMIKSMNEGRNEGINEGRNDERELFISDLLSSMTPEEISEKTHVSFEDVLQVQRKLGK